MIRLGYDKIRDNNAIVKYIRYSHLSISKRISTTNADDGGVWCTTQPKDSEASSHSN